jgi:hypothetical protein
LSAAQAVTTTVVSTNIIDQLAVGSAYGRECFVKFLIRTGFAGTGTVQFELQSATDAAFTTPITMFLTGAIAVATLVAGYVPAVIKLPLGESRYLRANYTTTSSPTTGTIDCDIVMDADVIYNGITN